MRCGPGKVPFGVRDLGCVVVHGARWFRPEASAAHGARGARRRIGASWYRGSLEAKRRGLSRAPGAAPSEPRCRSPSGLRIPRLLGRGIQARRAFGASGSAGSRWCGLHGGSRVRRLFGAGDPEGLGRAALAWLKERDLGRLESSGRSAASETRRPDSWRQGRWRCDAGVSDRSRSKDPTENTMSVCSRETGAAAGKRPGGAEKPKRGAVAGEV